MTETRHAIDCDIHPAVPSMQVLLPYLDEYWREHLIARGTEKLTLHLTSYPPNAPLVCRPDWRPARDCRARISRRLQRDALDAFGTPLCDLQCDLRLADVLQRGHGGGPMPRGQRLDRGGMARQRAAAARLDHGVDAKSASSPPTRSSAARPIRVSCRCCCSRRPKCRSAGAIHWPIYEAAERHDLPVGLHAGSSYRFAPSNAGFPSFFVEEYVGNAPSFKGELLSLITEGVFQKFPRLKVVHDRGRLHLAAGLCWRVDKIWRGVRREMPWVKEPPSELIRRHVRFTLAADPYAARRKSMRARHRAARLRRYAAVLDRLSALAFRRNRRVSEGFPERPQAKVMVDNPLATYSRLGNGRRLTRKEEHMNVSNAGPRRRHSPAQTRLAHRRLRHPSVVKSKADLEPFLSGALARALRHYGSHVRQAYSGSQAYPRMQPDTARADAWPPGGGPPASDLDFMRAAASRSQQHRAMASCIRCALAATTSAIWSSARRCRSAINEWQIAHLGRSVSRG